MSQNQITGTQNNDILSDTLVDDEIFALDGDDEIEVSSGNDFVDGGEGNDKLIVDYSTSEQDLSVYLYSSFDGYSNYGSIDTYFPLTGINSRIDFYSIESFVINSGSGNDNIDLGYDNLSDDEVNAGAGDDFILAGLGNDTIDGGAGNDSILLGLSNSVVDGGTGFDVLSIGFYQSQTGIVSFLTENGSGQYSDGVNTISFSNIEAVDIFGSNYDDVLVAVTSNNSNEFNTYPSDSFVDGQEGEDQLVADYSQQTEDLMFFFNSYDGSGSIEVNSYMSGYNSRIDFSSIESFVINSGSGNDEINLGYDNFSDNQVNAGAGDDFIRAGLGNDTIDGGAGFDRLLLDFGQSQTGVTSFLSDGDSGQYSNGENTVRFSNIEAVDVIGSNYNDVLVTVGSDSGNNSTMYPMYSWVDGFEGEDQLVADYSQLTEDLQLNLNNYGGSGSIDVYSNMSNYNSRIDFHNIESFTFISGSGHDNIDLGYDNFSDDQVNAGAGDDFIRAGLGNDTIDGGNGSDTFVYQLGAGTDVISDSSGDNDTIILDYGITLDNLNIEINDSDLVFTFNDFPDNELVLKNYVDSIDKIENVEIDGQFLTLEELLTLKSIPDVNNDRSGNDFITANLGDEEVNGGAGYDVLMVDFYQSQTGIVSFLTNGNSGQYNDGTDSLNFSNIEAVHIFGSNYNDVLVALNAENYADYEPTSFYPMNSIIDGEEGFDQLVADYSQQTEDLMLFLNNYGGSGSIDVYSNTTNYNSRIDFNNIESFAINSGSGHDGIDLGYNNISDDEVNAGAGDDWILAGLGNDTINGGAGFDILRLDFGQSQTGVTSFSTNSNSGQYSDGVNIISFTNIEAIDVFGSNYDDVLATVAANNGNGSTIYPMYSWVDGQEGEDQLVADYSQRSEDLIFNLNNYDGSGSIDVYSNMSDYNSRIDFTNIESFAIDGGNGNDNIELGYDNISNDLVNGGAGDDFIHAGLGNDTINGGAGNDSILLGSSNSIIDGGAGFDVLNLGFYQSQTGIVSFLTENGSGQYSDGFNTIRFSNIEAIDVFGSNYDDVLVAVISDNLNESTTYPMNSMIDGQEGEDQLVADYSQQTEDLIFNLNNYDGSGSIDVYSYMSDYNSRIDFSNIESFAINNGSGNDFIELGYDNYSDDQINAGAGDDVIFAGLGNDTINGGVGFDMLRLNFTQSQMGVTSFLSDSNSGQYSDGENTISFSNIEAIDVFGSNYDDVFLAVNDEGINETGMYPMNSIIDGGEGFDQLAADYSQRSEDLMFNLNSYGSSGLFDVNSYMTGYDSQTDINSIESLAINSGSGNDFIELGYGYLSDDVIDAGAGDDWINAGLGDDTIEGGLGNDTYIYELGSGVDLISDFGGDNDTIVFGAAINLDSLSLDFNNNDLTVSFNDSPEDQLVISDYLYSADSIENIQVAGQTFSVEEVIELTTVPEAIGEFGKIDNFNHESQTIQLENSYENPVVFALPLSRNGGDPAVVRITDIQNDSFTAYLQEAEYKDGSHTNESFSYMVLEAGTWELDNGSLLEVGKVNTNLVTSEGWESIAFDADFATAPVVLSQVQTNIESDFVRTRQKPASIDGFSLSMEEEDALKASGHANETIGWLAIDAGQGTWGDLEYQAGHTGREVTHRQYSLNFDQDFISEPSLFASLASYYGGDASGLRYQNLNENQVQIMIEEDQSLDSERNHTREIVDFLAISGNGDLNAIAYEPIDLI